MRCDHKADNMQFILEIIGLLVHLRHNSNVLNTCYHYSIQFLSKISRCIILEVNDIYNQELNFKYIISILFETFFEF